MASTRKSNELHEIDARTEGFSDAQLTLLTEVLREWNRGASAKPSRRALALLSQRGGEWDRVRALLFERWGLLARPTAEEPYIHYSYSTELTYRFTPEADVPVHVLWLLLAPELRETGRIGRALLRREAFMQALGRWPESSSLFTPRSIQAAEEALWRLTEWGYIWFQQAGDVWEITARTDCPWVSTGARTGARTED